MRGLIYGDVRGSIYEWKPVEEQKNIKESLHFTDDTVLGVAVADALITCYEKSLTADEEILQMLTEKLRVYANRYPDAGFSRSFQAWFRSPDPKPYGSKTNGAIMRCAAAGWLAGSAEEARRLGRLTAMPTHNHPEAMDAAALTAEIIYRLRMGEPIDSIYFLVNKRYKIPRLDDIRPIREFDFTCITTLPIAFAAFYEAVLSRDLVNSSGDDLVRTAVDNAISLGGDTDTNAAIAAEFAEAWNYAWTFSQDEAVFKGEPRWYTKSGFLNYEWSKTEPLLTPDLLAVLHRMDQVLR